MPFIPLRGNFPILPKISSFFHPLFELDGFFFKNLKVSSREIEGEGGGSIWL